MKLLEDICHKGSKGSLAYSYLFNGRPYRKKKDIKRSLIIAEISVYILFAT